MIPKIFMKDAPYPHFAASFGIAPGIVRADFSGDTPAINAASIEIPQNANIESILQVHRRKMLRRAANRRSAQLSRARKKAHLEELKTENTRLQRLVDVLDSQPELIFCVTAQGRLTHISERTINFIKLNLTNEDSDEDPTHLNQVLTKESVDSVLETITKLQKHSQTPTGDTDLNMLFAIKEVYFHDTLGNPIVGYLRCSKVYRRSSLNDLQSSDSIEKVMQAPTNQNSSSKDSGPPAKKAKKTAASTTNNLQEKPREETAVNNSGWNLSNFKMLADYASAFTTEEGAREDDSKHAHPSNSASNNSIAISDSVKSGSVSPAKSTDNDQEDEYVCVIRTTDNCFIQYRSHSDLLLFSSVVPTAHASHDYDLRATMGNDRRTDSRGDSPSDSNGNAQSESSGQRKTGTSSETGSDDNNVVGEENGRY